MKKEIWQWYFKCTYNNRNYSICY